MAVRTIFFNGPKGHRWVTAPVPSIEYLSAQPSSPQTDACAQDRRRFFGITEYDALTGWHGME